MNFFLAYSYLKYSLVARHAKGYGIHSPFIFDLVRDTIYDTNSFYAFEEIEAYREQLLKSKEKLEVIDLGVGSHKMDRHHRKVADLVRISSINKKYGELLFRLVYRFKPQTILELGTSIGMSTLYLSLPNKKADVFSIEGCENTAHFAAQSLAKFGLSNVQQVVGRFSDVLPDMVSKFETLDFVYIDGHHERKATLDYFQLCLQKVNNDSIFVFDDIYWSQGMSEAWEIIKNHPQVTVSIDLFQLGIVFFKKECQKQHFIVRY
ncbi:class I SAM-dependent methyltransferase [Marinilabiliaceae bacterium JC017]|nr:class I SAM-dependent methyltransferase [Marinilabiliaceae bacterium JC017]